MSAWKLVPVRLSEAMVDAMLEYRYDSVSQGYAAALAASPNPSEDEELVEKVRSEVWKAINLARNLRSYPISDRQSQANQIADETTRSILRLFGGGDE